MDCLQAYRLVRRTGRVGSRVVDCDADTRGERVVFHHSARPDRRQVGRIQADRQRALCVPYKRGVRNVEPMIALAARRTRHRDRTALTDHDRDGRRVGGLDRNGVS